MSKGLLAWFAVMLTLELFSFQLGKAWFWPLTASMLLAVLISIGCTLRRIERKQDGEQPSPQLHIQPPAEEVPPLDDPPITSMKDIFPYSRHDRTLPFD